MKPAADLKAQGNDAFKRGQLREAIDKYTAACKANPSEAIYPANLSAALYEAGRYKGSLLTIDKAMALNPEPKIAAKLALRAARCTLWLNTLESAETRLAHPALQQASDAEAISELKQSVAALAAPRHEASADAVRAAWDSEDAPPLTRDLPVNEPPEVFLNGHDWAYSLLDGVLTVPTLIPAAPEYASYDSDHAAKSV